MTTLARPHHPAPAPAPDDETAVLRVLLVEDDPDYSSLVGEMLADALGDGLDLICRASLAHAREDLASGGLDCILLDLSLPDSLGLSSLARVQELAPTVPVVVLSGQEREDVAVQAVHEGAQDYLVKRSVDPGLLARGIRYAMQRKRTELELERRALHDGLTGLPNRALLLDRLELSLAATERSRRLAAVLFLDLDGFKAVNDRHGHEAGDVLLRGVARRLLGLMRPSDTVARFGGDEFVILAPDLGHRREAVAVAERLSAGLREPFTVGDAEVRIAASIGVAVGRGLGAAPEALIAQADRMMYRAKRVGTPFELAERGEEVPRAASANGRLPAPSDRPAAGDAGSASEPAGDDVPEEPTELDRLLYVASHDLSEPLRVISGFTRLLESRHGDALGEEGTRFVASIAGAAGRMQSMIDALLALSRVARAPVAGTRVDTASTVDAALGELAGPIAEKGAKIRLGDLPAVTGDRLLLGHVFVGLIDNAIKFTDDRPPVVEVYADRGAGDWTFSVEDNGDGVPPEDARRIFELFGRLHGRDTPGLGMGLALCKRAVEKLGGRIWVDPGTDGGSAFRFTVPGPAEGVAD